MTHFSQQRVFISHQLTLFINHLILAYLQENPGLDHHRLISFSDRSKPEKGTGAEIYGLKPRLELSSPPVMFASAFVRNIWYSGSHTWKPSKKIRESADYYIHWRSSGSSSPDCSSYYFASGPVVSTFPTYCELEEVDDSHMSSRYYRGG